MNYSICTIHPAVYTHAAVFHEMAQGLREGLTELGHTAYVAIDTEDIIGTGIILGANTMLQPIPEGSIIINLEQAGTWWFTERYLNLLRKHTVWDYCETNIGFLKAHGIEAKLCGVGYADCLNCIPEAEEDIDVLFVGSPIERRNIIMAAIREEGLNLVHLFGKYGAERDSYIARAKIVLNIHCWPQSIFEIVRVSYLLANKRFVVSEGPAYAPLQEGLVFANTNDIVDACKRYVNDEPARRAVAQRGFDLFSQTRQSEYLKAVL